MDLVVRRLNRRKEGNAHIKKTAAHESIQLPCNSIMILKGKIKLKYPEMLLVFYWWISQH